MLTPRQQHLKNLIETSSILTTEERQEWLSMLELMNDKQLSDLENILSPQQAMPVKTPGLSHIANLPIGVADRVSDIAPPLPAASATQSRVVNTPAGNGMTKSKWLDEMKLIVEEKELPAPHQNAPAPEVHQAPIIPQTPAKKTAAPEHLGIGASAPANWEIKTVDDAAMLSVAIYKSMGAAKIISMLQALVRRAGYGNVLIALEKSNLHKVYVSVGHNMLANGTVSETDPITKQEFEEIADIFREIQVN